MQVALIFNISFRLLANEKADEEYNVDGHFVFAGPECGDVGHTCYYENDPCPSGTEECVKYECPLDGNKCCCNGELLLSKHNGVQKF